MSLRDVIASVEGREKRLTVFDPPSEAVVTDLREYFASQQVRIEVGESDSDLSGYAVLSDEDDHAVLAAVDLRDLEGAAEATAGVGEPRTFSGLLEHLDDTTFTSYDTEQMLAATREMEDRAWRKGTGELHAGFQRVGALRQQKAVYEDLAKKRLDIHAYCTPAADVPSVEGVTVHQADTPEIRSSWFVVFDGDGDPNDACALLAEDRGDGERREFYGFWTYDPSIVQRVLDHLRDRYLVTA
ncbi:DICT sensory domain-containing protein [Candidatus Halobonum tyrrellensis]|uniref:Sensor protein n=1 Tax=Candidatus Halobonum tyrrellensis G22 TaxID=1324957 RepID=V4HES9_9EURY|nr:DICT sensory domain-containing protein [Candidatus Halobonum tyrrellensis]ESP88613.1 sensor protein [Candidatus Halobonum tyrrellensis G22]